MALTQTLVQFRNNVRKFTDTEGTNALQRHPDADLTDYINRGIGAFHRILTAADPSKRTLTSEDVMTVPNTSLYDLPADFDHLVSIDLSAFGSKAWLMGYEPSERASLTNPSSVYSGVPFTYRLRGSNLELLPTPSGAYTFTLWYISAPTQLSSNGSAYDTINRLDDYIIAYASKFVAVKEKNWELVSECRTMLQELQADVEMIARSRDKNSPSRIVDEMLTNRFGRRVSLPRRWR